MFRLYRVSVLFLLFVVLLKKRTVPENVCFSYAATSRSCVEEELHEVSTPDVLSGGPSWSGLYGPVSWLIFFQFEPHGLVRNIQRESSRVAPMEIRHPGF